MYLSAIDPGCVRRQKKKRALPILCANDAPKVRLVEVAPVENKKEAEKKRGQLSFFTRTAVCFENVICANPIVC